VATVHRAKAVTVLHAKVQSVLHARAQSVLHARVQSALHARVTVRQGPRVIAPHVKTAPRVKVKRPANPELRAKAAQSAVVAVAVAAMNVAVSVVTARPALTCKPTKTQRLALI
jgi:hypothetical protein